MILPEIINIGSGVDISIRDLSLSCSGTSSDLKEISASTRACQTACQESF